MIAGGQISEMTAGVEKRKGVPTIVRPLKEVRQITVDLGILSMLHHSAIASRVIIKRILVLKIGSNQVRSKEIAIGNRMFGWEKNVIYVEEDEMKKQVGYSIHKATEDFVETLHTEGFQVS